MQSRDYSRACMKRDGPPLESEMSMFGLPMSILKRVNAHSQELYYSVRTALTPGHIAAAAHLPRDAICGKIGLCTAQRWS